jgi:hypothetical protein
VSGSGYAQIAARGRVAEWSRPQIRAVRLRGIPGAPAAGLRLDERRRARLADGLHPPGLAADEPAFRHVLVDQGMDAV